MRPLPYPGHSWSFTQHAVGIDAVTTYNFLKCAAPFEGQTEGYGEKITALMVGMGVLTANERDGKPDAWRDYQQILAELGLIISTNVCRALTITELGQLYLAGEIGFAELISTQSLRYQYPNGQKSTIQSKLRNTFADSGISALPDSLTELQTSYGVLIKPGLLILRVLIELFKLGHVPSITVSECQAFLIPCKNNSEWPAAIKELLSHRAAKSSVIDGIHRHARRNIQDWFKFLSKSDFFDLSSGVLSLSENALSRMSDLEEYCESQEDPHQYWFATDFGVDDKLAWFHWFGYLPKESQELLTSELSENPDYVDENYIDGLDIDDENFIASTSEIKMSNLDLEYLGRDSTFSSTLDMEALIDSLKKGAQKRHAKTLLHDRIIKRLAEKFISQGAHVESDPNSIDLCATWPSGDSAIFEVKTVTKRSIQNRLRSAIGQIQEYKYRREASGHGSSDPVVVINVDIDTDAWQRSFLDHIGVGLISTTESNYIATCPENFKTKDMWM